MRGIIATALFVSSPPLLAQHEVLIAEGDVLAGVGTVNDVSEVVVADNGRWAATVFILGAPGPSQALVLDGQVLLGPGDPLPGFPGEIFESAAALDLAPDGTLTWVANRVPTSASSGRAVYSGLTPLVRIGDPPVGPGLDGAGPWKRLFDARQDGAGGIVISGAFDRPGLLGVCDDVVVRLPSATAGGPVTVLAGECDELPGSIGKLEQIFDREYALAANATSALFQAFGTETSGVLLGDALVAEVGGPTPVFGSSWINFWRNALDLNQAGDLAFAGNTEGPGGSSTFLVWNDALVARTGASSRAIEPFEIESLAQGGTNAIAPVRLAETGALFWYADWADPDTSRDEGLFRDLDLVVQEGVTVVAGQRVVELRPAGVLIARPVFDVSEDGAAMVARVGLADGRVAAVRIAVDPLVMEIPGCAGNAASLEATPQTIGASLVAGLADSQTAGALGFVALSLRSTLVETPCGVDLPGFGELLVELGPADLIGIAPTVVPSLSGISVPAILGTIPDDLSLLGLELFVQGAWFDVAGTSVPFEPVRPSNGLRLVVGF